MSNKTLGYGLMVAGAVSLIVGVGVLLTGGSDPSSAVATPASTIEPTATAGGTPVVSAAPTTTAATTAPTTPATTPANAATPPTATSPATTATTTTTTTTTTATVPTSTLPALDVEPFIVDYAAHIAAGDTDTLFNTLLPQVRDGFGSDLCRAWIEREILGLSNYEQTGPASEPEPRTLSIGDARVPVESYIEAPVSFVFQGQSFESTATFVEQDGQLFWIGACR